MSKKKTLITAIVMILNIIASIAFTVVGYKHIDKKAREEIHHTYPKWEFYANEMSKNTFYTPVSIKTGIKYNSETYIFIVTTDNLSEGYYMVFYTVKSTSPLEYNWVYSHYVYCK